MAKDKLSAILLDCDFFDNPKVEALAETHTYCAVAFCLKLYCSLGKASGGKISYLIAGITAKKYGLTNGCEVLDFLIREGLLEKDGDYVFHPRIYADRANVAKKREYWRKQKGLLEDSLEIPEGIHEESLGSLGGFLSSSEPEPEPEERSLEKLGGTGERKTFKASKPRFNPLDVEFPLELETPQNRELWAEWCLYRSRHKAKGYVTKSGPNRLLNSWKTHAKEFPDALAYAMSRGWASCEPDWYFKEFPSAGNGPPKLPPNTKIGRQENLIKQAYGRIKNEQGRSDSGAGGGLPDVSPSGANGTSGPGMGKLLPGGDTGGLQASAKVGSNLERV